MWFLRHTAGVKLNTFPEADYLVLGSESWGLLLDSCCLMYGKDEQKCCFLKFELTSRQRCIAFCLSNCIFSLQEFSYIILN